MNLSRDKKKRREVIVGERERKGRGTEIERSK